MKMQKSEQMTEEVIRFLQKWGLWKDVSILVNGKRYYDDVTAPADIVFPDMEYVRAEACPDPEVYTSGLTDYTDPEGKQKTEWVNFANPEHIFDMVYEGPLSVLLYEREYETMRNAVSDAAWEEIFQKTDLLLCCMQEDFEVQSPEVLLELVAEGESVTPDERNLPETGVWDPMVFDTWEEYQEFAGWEDQDLQPRYQNFDTYGEYQEVMDKVWTLEDVMPLWNRLLEKAKETVRTEKGLLYCSEMTGQIVSEFDEIFERYGLWYDLGFSWSLSCHRQAGAEMAE